MQHVNHDASPLVAIGIVSAAPYLQRRDAVRDTWLRYPEIGSGEIVARFVVARPLNEREAATAQAEAQKTGDMIVFRTGVSGRVWSPLHTAFRWLQHAASNVPFRDAQYIAKMDDDAYLIIPEFARHLRQMRNVPQTAPQRNVYAGIFYYAAYMPNSFTEVGAGYTLLTANQNNGECIRAGTCEGSFPFTTGSMQLISRPLAHALASAPTTAAHIESSKPLVKDTRRSAAYEDVWMGYALWSLLHVRDLTLVNLDRFNYYFDQRTKPTMKNTTILVHMTTKPGRNTLEREKFLGERIHAAHRFALRQHCASNGTLACNTFHPPSCRRNTNFTALCLNRAQRYLSKYSYACSLSPDRRVCPNGQAYEILERSPRTNTSKP